MPGVSTLTSNVTGVLPTEYIVKARTTYEYGQVMKNLMYHHPLPKGKGLTLQIPKFGQLTAYQFTRGDTISQDQKHSTSTITISPISVAVQTVLDEVATLALTEDLALINGKLHGQAFARFEDKDLLTLLDGFGTSLGSAAALKIGHIYAGIATISGGTGGTVEAMDPPYVAVVHPNSYHSIAEDIAGLTSGALVGSSGTGDVSIRDEVLRKYLIADIGTVKIFRAGNLTIASGAAKGGMFAKEALWYVEFRKMRTEERWEQRLQGTDVVTTAIYGRGEYLDSGGVEFNVSASTPTS